MYKPWRTGSTILGIAVGCSLFLTVVLINRSVLVSYRQGVEALTGRAELIVSSQTSAWLAEASLARFEQSPVVAHASPSVHTMGKITWGQPLHEDVLNFIGLDLLDAHAVKNFAGASSDPSLNAGDKLVFMNHLDSILLARDYAQRNGLHVGDGLLAYTPSGPKPLTIRGLLPSGGVAKAHGGAVAVMDIDAARLTFALTDKTSRIDLFLSPQTTPALAIAQLSRELGPTFRIEEPAERVEQFQNSFRSFQSLVEFLGGLGLLVAWVLVVGTLQICVAERHNEIGMLRALGASRLQVLIMILGESFCLGALGGALGIIVSIGLSHAMLATVVQALSAQALVKIPEPQLHLSLAHCLAFLLATALGAASAGLFPAWRAANVPPLASMVKGQAEATLAAGLQVSRLKLPFLSPLFEMALQNVVRRPKRTATAVVLLAVALAFVVVIDVMSLSFQDTLSTRFDRSLTPDLVLIGQGKGRADQRQVFHENFIRDLQAVPGVKGAYGQRLVPIRYEGREISIRSYDDMGTDTGYGILDVLDRKKLETGIELYGSRDFTILVSEAFQKHFQKNTGDTIELQTPSGPTPARIIGITSDFTSPVGAIYTSRRWYRKLWQDELLSGIGIMVKPGFDARVVQATIRSKFSVSRNLSVLSDREYYGEVMGVAGQAITYVKFLRWAALLIAMIALFNSFMVDIRERWQEIGVLRALGMSPGQLVTMLGSEALLKGIAAAVLALIFGLSLARFGVHSYLNTELGWVFHLHVAWQTPVLCTVLAALVSLAAVVVPAAKALSTEVGPSLADL